MGRRDHVRHYVRPDGLPPVKGYSHAVAFSGRMVAVSGQVPMNEKGEVVGGGDAEAQVRQVFDNLVAALAAAGADLSQVVKLTVYLTDVADLPVFRRVRDDYLSPEALPACSLVQVGGLIHPSFRIEVDALAAI